MSDVIVDWKCWGGIVDLKYGVMLLDYCLVARIK